MSSSPVKPEVQFSLPTTSTTTTASSDLQFAGALEIPVSSSSLENVLPAQGFLAQLYADQQEAVSDVEVPVSSASTEHCLNDDSDSEFEETTDMIEHMEADRYLYDLYVSGKISFDELTNLVNKSKFMEVMELDDDTSELDDDSLFDFYGPLTSPKQTFSSQKRKSDQSSATTSTANKKKKTQSGHSSRTSAVPKMASFLDDSLKGLIGQASLQMAKADFKGAIQICEEVLKIQPKAFEAYEIMSEAYESSGEIEKAKQYLLLSAHVHSCDPQKWIKLANIAKGQGELREATMFLTRALRYNTEDDLSLRIDRAEMYKVLKENRKFLEGYLDVLRRIEEEMTAEQCLDLARELADGFYNLVKDPNKAALCYEIVFAKHPQLLRDDEANILIDLQLKSVPPQFTRCLAFLIRHYNVAFTCVTTGKTLTHDDIANGALDDGGASYICTVPESLVNDLYVKLCTSLIYHGCSSIVVGSSLLDRIYQLSISEFCDWYFEIVEAFMQKECYTEALRVMTVMLDSGQCTDKAVVWLTYAHCLEKMKKLDEAVEAYTKTVELAPQYLEARLSLSNILVSLSRSTEALQVLSYNSDSEEAKELLFHKCIMLASQGDSDGFIQEAWQLLFSDLEILFQFHGYTSLQSLHSLITRGKRTDAVWKKVKQLEQTKNCLKYGKVKPDDLWDIFVQLVSYLSSSCQWERLDKATLWAVYHPAFFISDKRFEQINFLALTSCIFTKQFESVAWVAKELCVHKKYRTCNSAMNLFGLIVNQAQNATHDKWIMRMLRNQELDSYPLLLLHAQSALIAGSYKHAIATLTLLWERKKDDPMIPLLLGIAFVSLGNQKLIGNRHYFVLHGILFINEYAKLRGRCQEVLYNLGRLMHRLAIFHAAIDFYEQALVLKPVGNAVRNDLSAEIAFNLIQIYKHTCRAKCSALLQKYLVV